MLKKKKPQLDLDEKMMLNYQDQVFSFKDKLINDAKNFTYGGVTHNTWWAKVISISLLVFIISTMIVLINPGLANNINNKISKAVNYPHNKYKQIVYGDYEEEKLCLIDNEENNNSGVIVAGITSEDKKVKKKPNRVNLAYNFIKGQIKDNVDFLKEQIKIALKKAGEKQKQITKEWDRKLSNYIDNN